jgi:hypothetical protein
MKSEPFTLITGATSGIGYELALIAARENNNLLLIARDIKKLEEVRDEIGKRNKRISVKILALDLAKNGASKKVSTYCNTNHVFVETLINNAGFGDYGEFSSSDLNVQSSMIALNVTTLTELTHLFLPAMLANKAGKIMNLGSVASFLPGPLMSVYFATKNYVLSFSRALSEELRGTDVTVTCLCPGATNTGFGNAAHVSETHSTANPKTTAKEVAEFGWYSLQAGESVAIYGRGNRAMLQLVKFIPRNLIARLVKRVQK